MPTPSNPTIAVVVLAGGSGRRIGGDKPLRLLDGMRLVDRSLSLARSFSGHVALSIGSGGAIPGCDVEQIEDPAPDWGAIGGLAAGLDFARRIGAETMLTLPCDCPFLPADLSARLGAALGPEMEAAIPITGGQRHVAAGLWCSGVRDRLIDYAANGGRALHGMLDRIPFAEVAWPSEPSDPFFNINTPADLERARCLLAGRPESH